MSDFKNCTKCGHSLPATAEFFSPQKRGVRGLHSQCRECIQKARRERYQNNPEYRERLLAQNKASRERRGHRTRAKASPEELERNRIRMIEYRKRPDVIERKKAYSKEYKRRPEVAERIKEYSKEYRKRPEVKARIKAYNNAYKGVHDFERDDYMDIDRQEQDINEIEETCFYICGHLNETTPHTRMQIRKIIRLLGTDQALAFLKQAREVEKSGGMKTATGERRTIGGTFFHLVKSQADETLVNAVWPKKDWGKFKERKKQARAQSQASEKQAS